jgi:hypothetical protein
MSGISGAAGYWPVPYDVDVADTIRTPHFSYIITGPPEGIHSVRRAPSVSSYLASSGASYVRWFGRMARGFA